MTKWELEMAGYWSSSCQVLFLMCLGTEKQSRPCIFTQKKEKKRTMPIFSQLDWASLVSKGFIIVHKEHHLVSRETQWAIPSDKNVSSHRRPPWSKKKRPIQSKAEESEVNTQFPYFSFSVKRYAPFQCLKWNMNGRILLLDSGCSGLITKCTPQTTPNSAVVAAL